MNLAFGGGVWFTLDGAQILLLVGLGDIWGDWNGLGPYRVNELLACMVNDLPAVLSLRPYSGFLGEDSCGKELRVLNERVGGSLVGRWEKR